MENYFLSQRDHIFRNVEVLIYVFDVESREVEKDLHYYQSCLEAIMQFSRDAKIFCLLHKMDLVAESARDAVRPRGRAGAGPARRSGRANTGRAAQRVCAALAQIFADREAELRRRSLPLEVTIFRTSIWDETLYKVRTAADAGDRHRHGRANGPMRRLGCGDVTAGVVLHRLLADPERQVARDAPAQLLLDLRGRRGRAL